MPDHDADDRMRIYRQGCDADPGVRQLAITACPLCDDDGYRPNRTVCDHQDRAATAARGIAACRAALAKDGPR